MNSFWIESTKDKIKLNSLNKDVVSDVCIIGGGLFGLSTGYYLSENGLKVVVLDKENIAEKVSGNTTGKITSQHGIIYKYLVDSFSVDYAKQYLEANEDAIKNIENIIKKENIECDFCMQDNYVYTKDENLIKKIKDENDIVNKLGFKSEFVTEIPLRQNILGAIKFPNQAQFHPRKYCLGLAEKIIENSGEIYINSTVYNVNKDEGNYIVFTKNNKVKSKYIVFASHYPFINVPGFYFSKMYQSTSYIIAVDTKTELEDGMYINEESPTYSFRTLKDGNRKLLLMAGSDHKTGSKIDLSNAYKNLEQKAKELYKKSEVLYRWNAEDCITLDKIPYIGEFSHFTPNMYIGTGFNKWGITNSNVAANIITNKILGKSNKNEEVFKSTRFHPIKNKGELGNVLKEATNSIIINKFKIKYKDIEQIKNDEGHVIEKDGEKIGIYKDIDGNIHAVNPICTHLGCLLSWNNVDKTWDCPCHGSRFNFEGKNIYDPAIGNLKPINLQIIDM